MKRSLVILALGWLTAPCAGSAASRPAFRALAFYADRGEPDHIRFAEHALAFFREAAERDGFAFESTTDWNQLNSERLRGVRLVLWINDFPKTAAQRASFERYMEHGGGWLGFHVAAYNDEETRWPWFVSFLGGAVFYGNNWPPLPATLRVDDRTHPVCRHLGAALEAPANEWYIWKPSPRRNRDVRVLLTLDPANYPIGLKDTITAGDLPVVWTNTRYRMLYVNMGHGDKIFDSREQNRMFEDAVLWLSGTRTP